MKPKRSILVLLLLGLIIRIVISFQIYSGDVNNHMSWGRDLLIEGPRGIYEREFFLRNAYGTMTPTYPPFALALFSGSEIFYQAFYKTSWWLNNNIGLFPSKFIYFVEDQDTRPAFFKVWAIAADLVIAYLVFLITKSKLGTALVLFNPAFFYNSAYWGQTEALPILFSLLGVYFIIKKQPNLALISMTLSLLSKQSAILFIPIFIFWMLRKFSLYKTLKSAFLAIVFFWIAFIPFYKSGNLLSFPFTVYLNKIQTGSGSDLVVDHAFNFWSLLGFEDDKLSDKNFAVGNLSFFKVGLLVYGMHYFVLMLLLKNIDDFILGLGLAAAFGFLYLTRMHERYLEPALPYLLIASLKNKILLAGFLFLSIFSFLNLFHNWWTPSIDILKNWMVATTNVQFLIIGLMVVVYTYFFVLIKKAVRKL